MGVEYTFSSECGSGSAMCHATYIIRSEGWSGKVVKTSGDNQEERSFKFHGLMTISGSQDGTLETTENAYVERNEIAVSYIGISLEHFGEWWTTGWSHEKKNQIIGLYPLGETPSNPGEKPAYGAKSVDSVPSFTAQGIIVEGYTNNITSQTYGAERVTNIAIGTSSGYRGLMSCEMKPGNGGGWIYDLTVEIETDLPIFETDADLMVYCNSRGEDTSTIKNIADPEEEYKEQFDFWWLKNKWGHNTRNVSSGSNTTKNYRFYPKRRGICFIKHTPTAAEPYDRVLYNYSSYDAKYAAWGEDADEDFTDNPNVTTHFLTKNISFGSNDYYTCFDFETNIPLWNNQQEADDYFNGLKDISEADNYAYISRQDDAILNPDLPGTDVDEATAMRTNGMRFSYGVRLYEITNIELSNLMQEMFDPANVEDVIEGNKLMGSNTINAVSGVMYLPFADLSEICELGNLANIKIGSWEAQSAQGKRIISNEGTIDCGSFFYNRTYLDYRDYEPYNLLFVNLPFCGCHQLTISKYLDKTVNVSYNVDVCTGGIVAKLTADGILVDIFEGTCGASRPISATDNNAYINSIVGAITGASASASGSIEGITNSVSNVGKAAASGSGLAAGGAAGVAVGVAGGVAASGIYTGYQIKNAVDNPPQIHRGSLAGNLGYYLNSKPTFLFFTKRSIRPENELETVGYPSGHGGTVGSFSGFLSCSAFKLADGFTGTDEERAEIMDIMRGGIYL